MTQLGETNKLEIDLTMKRDSDNSDVEICQVPFEKSLILLDKQFGIRKARGSTCVFN